MAYPIKMIREAAGSYRLSNGMHSVSILRNEDLIGPDKWLAYADWDQHRVTDPLPTLREARRHGEAMLAE